MKIYIFLVTLLMTQLIFGQDLIKSADKVDDFTGERQLNTNVITVASGKGVGYLKFCLGRYISKDSSDMYALNIISTEDLGCSGSNLNYIHFLFSDGTTLKYDNDQAQVDCNDINISIYVLNKNDFENKIISKVRFAKSSDYADYLWTYSQNLYTFFDILK